MRVWISVHGRFHAFELARELHAQRGLVGISTTYPGFMVRRFLSPDIRVCSVSWLEMLRRIAGRSLAPSGLDAYVARAFGRFSARTFDRNADVLVGWSGATWEAIAPAKAAGLRVVIERGSSHIVHQTSVLTEEFQRFGIERAPVDPEIVERELREYEAADAISVPSRFAADTFVARGMPRQKIIVNPYGADLSRITGPLTCTRRSQAVRILFVGGVGLRKGIPWLLRGFARVGGNATLHIVGPLEPGMADIVRREPLERVTFHGPLRGAALSLIYEEADVFCLPSLEEGFPLALLRGMATGLPVVCTPETGTEEAVTHSREGFIVPARDTRALGDALDTLVMNDVLRQTMGEAARARVLAGFRWSDYGARAISAYEGLL